MSIFLAAIVSSVRMGKCIHTPRIKKQKIRLLRQDNEKYTTNNWKTIDLHPDNEASKAHFPAKYDHFGAGKANFLKPCLDWKVYTYTTTKKTEKEDV